MSHQVKPLTFKPSRLSGLSERLLASHYENNYGGAVRRLNAIGRRLRELDWSGAAMFEINGLKREELIAANSMTLHEAYFESLGGSGGPVGRLAERLEQDFGSLAAWQGEFTAIAKALGGGSGWVLLTWSERQGRLINQWAADHAHVLAEGRTVLALDMYEHAYHLDFGSRAAAYVDAFMDNIAWDRADARFRGERPAENTGAAAEAVVERLAGGEALTILDVRKREDLAGDMIRGAIWRDPENLDWIADLPAGRPVFAYCVYGFQVSQDAVAALRRAGVDARNIAGGIAAWHAIGAPVQPLP